ncbi:hypothetical protein [Arthrobacter sp. ATA002]|uniref:hypothetical protein n=1 Tax=Arthrobacter sp. ATA002 TaxID=2991715 RepID=UPI002E2F4423|nr:hypothetical protein [Arthrobacter sp. ATA002]
MTATIVVLTEESLNDVDISNLRYLVQDNPARFTVLVPSDTGRNLLVDVLDNLSLLEFAAAFRDLTGGKPTKDEETKAAEVELAESLQLLQASGLEATGSVTGEDPVQAVVAAAKAAEAQQVVVITTLTPWRTPSAPTGQTKPRTGSECPCCTSTPARDLLATLKR